MRTAIQTELPYLFSKEHHTADLESITTTNTEQSSDVDASSGLHITRWKVIFNKMDKELSDEGKHLVCDFITDRNLYICILIFNLCFVGDLVGSSYRNVRTM